MNKTLKCGVSEKNLTFIISFIYSYGAKGSQCWLEHRPFNAVVYLLNVLFGASL